MSDEGNRAIEVLTALVSDDPDETAFAFSRAEAYLGNPEDARLLVTDLVNLALRLLVRIEKESGTPLLRTLQDIAAKPKPIG